MSSQITLIINKNVFPYYIIDHHTVIARLGTRHNRHQTWATRDDTFTLLDLILGWPRRHNTIHDTLAQDDLARGKTDIIIII